ncbi:hypothetical protein SYNTR_1299 [Candidatus Syntrophocurvum alkaliphilum]|uniref:DUF4491 domain-containing protein n=1 Tax=Candidatus Syntrophocurvum alkaliphilum TaxID=2293317 RepID=A0A6I6DG64_9FIRM|nr:DUF4491 family protein [Candidatus Syntrophocurvum alkaliphilum]QGT99892.1 hypothetical protein SYNTR_1299 [Candidatus Syntrophocurvum alkaliphilum]
MNFTGLIVGAISFLIIGILHPIVIKVEYYFGKHYWPVFAISGLICCIASVLVDNILISIPLAILGFSLFWSIMELFEQEKRVQKGWFPANPAKSKNQDK